MSVSRNTKRGGAKKEIKKKIFIIGEGKSELSYFQDLKKESDLKFNLKPELGKDGSDFHSIFEKASDNADSDIYKQIYCLIDLDYIIKQKLFEEYTKAKKELLSKTKKMVTIIESLPCFELWVLLHFEKTQSTNIECQQLIDRKLKKHIPNYTKAMPGLYSKIKDKQSKALKFSKELKRLRQKEIKNMGDVHCRDSFTDIDELIQILVKEK
ncbi:MAG: RloB family protein [Methanimicrococcus sp.]|nr:RloB family protein [Methanimicrococcus sp.]